LRSPSSGCCTRNASLDCHQSRRWPSPANWNNSRLRVQRVLAG
jgi:hypothetical protein